MNNSFFNNMQANWLKNWDLFNLNNWMSQLQEQNAHLCNPSCSGLSQHWSALMKETVEVARQNMDLVFDNVQNNIKAPNLENVFSNSQQLAQSLAGNTTAYMKNAFEQVTEASNSMSEHIQEAMAQNLNAHNNKRHKADSRSAKNTSEK